MNINRNIKINLEKTIFGLCNSEHLMQYTLSRKNLEYVASYLKLKGITFNSRKYF